MQITNLADHGPFKVGTLLFASVACLLVTISGINTFFDTKPQQSDTIPTVSACVIPEAQLIESRDHFVEVVTSKFKIKQAFAEKVVDYAIQYQHEEFPTAHDLLSLIAVESSFRPKVYSNLKRDPAYGLTQIRPNAWRHKYKRSQLESIENQVKFAAEILAHNYKRLNDKNLALQAYNIGLTAVLQGRENWRYVDKFYAESAEYYSYSNNI